MNRTALLQQSRSLGWTLGSIEKDYLQHILLRAIAGRCGPALVFKGGTALQKVWGLPRFSEDLDFTNVGTEDPLSFVEPALRGFQHYGHKARIAKERRGASSWSCQVSVEGPLFQGLNRSRCFIRIELSLREKTLLEPAVQEIIPRYSNLPPYLVTVMAPAEMLAEKVRTLYGREKARDLYDLAFLLNRGTIPSRKLIDHKLALYKLAFNARDFHVRVALVAQQWQEELERLLPQPPNLAVALAKIQTGFAELE